MNEYFKTVNKKGQPLAYYVGNAEDDIFHLRCLESEMKQFKEGSYYFIKQSNIDKELKGYTLTRCLESEKLFLILKTKGGNNE